jgi:hypothetical protein
MEEQVSNSSFSIWWIYWTSDTNATESWNGTSWTTVNSMNTTRYNFGAGTQTAVLVFGGNTPTRSRSIS